MPGDWNCVNIAYFRISQRPALIDGLSLNGTSLHQLRFGRTTSHKVDIQKKITVCYKNPIFKRSGWSSMLRTGPATPCWTARLTSTAAPCCSSSLPPTCTPATGRHSVSFVRPLIGHSTALWLADDWHQTKCVSPERWLSEWALKCSGEPAAPSPGRWGPVSASGGNITHTLCCTEIPFYSFLCAVSSNFLRHTKRRILIIRGVLTRCFSTDWVS